MPDASLSAPLASLGARLLAFIADCLLLFALALLLQAALVAAGLHPFVAPGWSLIEAPGEATLHLWVSLCTTLPFWIYFALCFASAAGATLGQRLLKLRVVAGGGGRLPGGRAAVRAAVLLVPFELNHVVQFHAGPWDGGDLTLYLLGYIMVIALVAVYLLLPLRRADGRSVHDLAAGSQVVRR